MFNELGDDARYVTRNYSRFLNRDLEREGLKENEALNMYDYFQGFLGRKRVKQPLRDLAELPLDEYHLVAHGANYTMIERNGEEIGRIDVMPATVGLVNTITFYDRYGNTELVENYDWRGFKSSIDYYHASGKLGSQIFLNAEGVPVLEITHMNIGKEVHPTMWKLLDYKGRTYRFNNEDQLFLFFLNEIGAEYPNSVMVSDRRPLDRVVGQVQFAGAKYAYFHDTHTPEVKAPVHGKLYEAYRYVLEEAPEKFDGVIVPTVDQQSDLKKRYPDGNFFAIPDTYVDKHQIAAGKRSHSRKQHLILFSGRLSPEKQPEHALRVFAEVLKKVPDARFEFRGYPSSADYLQQLKKQVETLNIKEAVEFGEYLPQADLPERYGVAEFIVQTSKEEGLGMNLIEAMSYGVVPVSFDITYGTKELLEDGVDGVVVPLNADELMAEKIVHLMQHTPEWRKLSKAAIAKSNTFDAESVHQLWQQLSPVRA
jgi:poly(glycerol-phosphate) alpha-glucosyltransferase